MKDWGFIIISYELFQIDKRFSNHYYTRRAYFVLKRNVIINMKERFQLILLWINKIFGGLIGFFIIYPLFYSIGLTFFALNYQGEDVKEMIIGVFNNYIIIETITLSVAFVVVSVVMTISKKTQYFVHLKKMDAITINSAILGYSILGIFITLLFHFLLSFSSPKQIDYIVYTGLFFSSFFVLGSILGLFLFTEKIFNLWSNKNIRGKNDNRRVSHVK